MDEVELQVAGARENLHASELDRWVRAVPRPAEDPIFRAFYGERRTFFGSTATACLWLGIFGAIALGFAGFMFDAMNLIW
ncbi:MAG: hypothetical protein HOW73_42050 [Polyangiaceae bacterium]|nr:hypothetical protein [Polyangiaceae bacterium]